VEEFLGLLARAVQQLHTYPASSPLCVTAVDACARALAGFTTRDSVAFRVTPGELIVDEIPTGRGALVEQELAQRLHRASVASVTFDRAATPREIARFCEDLLRCGERGALQATLLERLTDHGVDRIAVEMACRPEVLEAPAPAGAAADDLRRERQRFEAQLARGGAVNYLYPPQKGWVRIEPHAAPAAVSLLDLAVLADDPARLATWLIRLTDDDTEIGAQDALQRKYSDVTMLFSALDPQIARRMFAKLARAVLDLEPSNRQALLRRTVLPGLLDGRIDGAILRDFPDMDLAEALCLLLDLETAAPELLSTALSRLELSPERHQTMVPLLEERLKERDRPGADEARETTLVRHARELVRVHGQTGKSFADFMAFDLSLDDSAAGTLDLIRAVVPATDATGTQLTCLWHLTRLEPNPEAVNGFLTRSYSLLSALEAGGRGQELPQWLACYRDLSERIRVSRPDVAAVVDGHLAGFCTLQRAAWLADLSLCEPGGREAASAVIRALGPAVAPSLAALLDDTAGLGQERRGGQNRARAAANLLVEHAVLLAPAVPPLLEGCTPGGRRALLRVLGAAGAGYEQTIGACLSSDDEQTAREALRALARLGTSRAAAMVAAEIEKGRGTLSVAAEETLWHFPVQEAQRQTRELLSRRDFARHHPQATERLLDRAARTGAPNLEPVLLGLAPMRFRLWNPALARVARKANAMLKSPRTPEARP
jgi:hypothetical protein